MFSQLIVRPSNVCNIRCPFCCSRNVLDEGRSLEPISAQYLLSLVQKYNLGSVLLCGHGETTLASNFLEIYNTLSPHVKQITTITNVCAHPISWWKEFMESLQPGCFHYILLSLSLGINEKEIDVFFFNTNKWWAKKKDQDISMSISCCVNKHNMDLYIERCKANQRLMKNVGYKPDIHDTQEEQNRVLGLVRENINFEPFVIEMSLNGENNISGFDSNSINVEIGGGVLTPSV